MALLTKTISLSLLSAASVLACTSIASAQQITDFAPPNIDAADFSQGVTDAVTQGFRENQDRLFFEEGLELFEQEIRLLQAGENAEAILNIEAVFDDWESLETPAGATR